MKASYQYPERQSTPAAGRVAETTLSILGMTAVVAVTEPDQLFAAEATLLAVHETVDRACGSGRSGHEISRVNALAGTVVPVSPVLAAAVRVALHAAEATAGLVDPTFATGSPGPAGGPGTSGHRASPTEDPRAGRHGDSVAGWRRVELAPDDRWVSLPSGVGLDLRTTVRAMTADWAATGAADLTGCGVLIGLDENLAVAGAEPAGGWRVVAGDRRVRIAPGHPTALVLRRGGLATATAHDAHRPDIAQPAGHVAEPERHAGHAPYWRMISVIGASSAAAAAASAAAATLGPEAAGWLAEHELPARLVTAGGRVVTVAGWPSRSRVPS